MESRIRSVLPSQNEIQRRQYLGIEARNHGCGGISAVSRASGVSRTTITRGVREIESGLQYVPGNRIRAVGGGRKSLLEKYPTLKDTILSVVRDATYGDPEKTCLWTSLSQRKIAKIVKEKAAEAGFNINITHKTVGKILKRLGYSRQQNKKNKQVGKESEFRDEQFNKINKDIDDFFESGDPVISVDCKKKENLGNFKNNGTEYRKEKDPREVYDHDFPIDSLGKAVPYGIYDINNNFGFVSLGNSHDTAEFAVNSIHNWWLLFGQYQYSDATRLLITCDSGGSNGCRVRLWKQELSKLANTIGLDIYVVHYPTGTSKWNKIEHHLFSYISKSWQGKPLLNLETTKKYIESTTTTTGLKVACEIDNNKYSSGIKVSEKEFKKIPIIHDSILKKWNYHFTHSSKCA